MGSTRTGTATCTHGSSGRRRTTALGVAASLLLAGAAFARVEVRQAEDADFSGYRTYAWRPGTPAARPEVQEWIVRAVERELEARGLAKVSGDPADLYVTTHAFASMDSETRSRYAYVEALDVGITRSNLVLTAEGVLIVDLVDGRTDRTVWRGTASEVMASPSQEKVRKKIEEVTRKMFKRLPAS